MAEKKRTRLRICELNPHLLCALCGGYLIDATTIMECLHSFCKTCILRYLETSNYCPICEVLIHKKRPWQNIRLDHTLQNVVYKMVPGLFKLEMQRRRDFYEKNPPPGGKEMEQVHVAPERIIFSEDEKFSVSLEFSPNGRAVQVENEKALTTTPHHDKRFLLCPANVCIGHLKKFVRLKYTLPECYQIDLFYSDEPLEDTFSLMDVAYIYSWRRESVLTLYYSFYQRPRSRRRVTASATVTKHDHHATANSHKVKTKQPATPTNGNNNTDSSCTSTTTSTVTIVEACSENCGTEGEVTTTTTLSVSLPASTPLPLPPPLSVSCPSASPIISKSNSLGFDDDDDDDDEERPLIIVTDTPCSATPVDTDNAEGDSGVTIITPPKSGSNKKTLGCGGAGQASSTSNCPQTKCSNSVLSSCGESDVSSVTCSAVSVTITATQCSALGGPPTLNCQSVSASRFITAGETVCSSVQTSCSWPSSSVSSVSSQTPGNVCPDIAHQQRNTSDPSQHSVCAKQSTASDQTSKEVLDSSSSCSVKQVHEKSMSHPLDSSPSSQTQHSTQLTKQDSTQIVKCHSAQPTKQNSIQLAKCDSAQLTKHDSTQLAKCDSAQIAKHDSTQLAKCNSAQPTKHDSIQLTKCDSAQLTKLDSTQLAKQDSAQLANHDLCPVDSKQQIEAENSVQSSPPGHIAKPTQSSHSTESVVSPKLVKQTAVCSVEQTIQTSSSPSPVTVSASSNDTEPSCPPTGDQPTEPITSVNPKLHTEVKCLSETSYVKTRVQSDCSKSSVSVSCPSPSRSSSSKPKDSSDTREPSRPKELSHSKRSHPSPPSVPAGQNGSGKSATDSQETKRSIHSLSDGKEPPAEVPSNDGSVQSKCSSSPGLFERIYTVTSNCSATGIKSIFKTTAIVPAAAARRYSDVSGTSPMVGRGERRASTGGGDTTSKGQKDKPKTSIHKQKSSPTQENRSSLDPLTNMTKKPASSSPHSIKTDHQKVNNMNLEASQSSQTFSIGPVQPKTAGNQHSTKNPSSRSVVSGSAVEKNIISLPSSVRGPQKMAQVSNAGVQYVAPSAVRTVAGSKLKLGTADKVSGASVGTTTSTSAVITGDLRIKLPKYPISQLANLSTAVNQLKRQHSDSGVISDYNKPAKIKPVAGARISSMISSNKDDAKKGQPSVNRVEMSKPQPSMNRVEMSKAQPSMNKVEVSKAQLAFGKVEVNKEQLPSRGMEVKNSQSAHNKLEVCEEHPSNNNKLEANKQHSSHTKMEVIKGHTSTNEIENNKMQPSNTQVKANKAQISSTKEGILTTHSSCNTVKVNQPYVSNSSLPAQSTKVEDKTKPVQTCSVNKQSNNIGVSVTSHQSNKASKPEGTASQHVVQQKNNVPSTGRPMSASLPIKLSSNKIKGEGNATQKQSVNGQSSSKPVVSKPESVTSSSGVKRPHSPATAKSNCSRSVQSCTSTTSLMSNAKLATSNTNTRPGTTQIHVPSASRCADGPDAKKTKHLNSNYLGVSAVMTPTILSSSSVVSCSSNAHWSDRTNGNTSTVSSASPLASGRAPFRVSSAGLVKVRPSGNQALHGGKVLAPGQRVDSLLFRATNRLAAAAASTSKLLPSNSVPPIAFDQKKTQSERKIRAESVDSRMSFINKTFGGGKSSKETCVNPAASRGEISFSARHILSPTYFSGVTRSLSTSVVSQKLSPTVSKSSPKPSAESTSPKPGVFDLSRRSVSSSAQERKSGREGCVSDDGFKIGVESMKLDIPRLSTSSRDSVFASDPESSPTPSPKYSDINRNPIKLEPGSKLCRKETWLPAENGGRRSTGSVGSPNSLGSGPGSPLETERSPARDARRPSDSELLLSQRWHGLHPHPHLLAIPHPRDPATMAAVAALYNGHFKVPPAAKLLPRPDSPDPLPLDYSTSSSSASSK